MTRVQWPHVVLVGAILCSAVGQRASASPCGPVPCQFTYSLSVRYTLNGAPKFGIIAGSDSVTDSDLDRSLGSLQTLVQQLFGPQAVFTEVDKVTLGSQTAAALAASDVLLVRDGDVLLWINAPNSSAAGLHVSTTTASTKSHVFSFKVIAEGSESPLVEFDYTIHAAGAEHFPKAVRITESIDIPYHDDSDLTCRKLEGYVCLDPDCTLSSATLQKVNVSRNSIDSISTEGRCAKYNVECSGTNGWSYNKCRGFFVDCMNCGSWYEATVIVNGTCPSSRAWSRSVSGVGKARNGDQPEDIFTTDYAKSGGVLGSGLSDTTTVDQRATYSGEISNCRVDGVAINCDFVHPATLDSALEARTDYTRQVQQIQTGSGTLDSTQGIHSFGTFTFTPPNHDVRYSLEARFHGITYRNANSDPGGIVDVGPFSLWIGGTNGDELFGSFDRSSVPSAVIDSILPNPALLKEPVTFTGHGLGAFTGYEWRTHRVDQPVQTLETKATFSKGDLVAGKHLISFRVLGGQISPSVYAGLAINQPPVAFINHVANVNDAVHPSIALLLRDNIPSDPFRFDGSGIDFDGSIDEWEWKSNIDGELGKKPVFQRSLSLGVHTITLRVRDNRGSWSAAATAMVTVRRPPILLVHGMCGDESKWGYLAGSYNGGVGWFGPQWTIRGTGGRGPDTDVVIRTFDPNGDGITNDSPSDVGLLIAAEIEAMKSRYGVRTVNLVAHSMGGLSSRSYIQSPAFRGDVNKLVMLGPPNHGSSGADIVLISNGYSMEEVELYVPSLAIRGVLLTIGLVVDLLDFVGLGDGIICKTQDSPGFHAARPHGTFVRGLNKTLKDEGTEDFTPTENRDDAISALVAYFVIHGKGATISHSHLPKGLETAIYIATAGSVNLDHMDLMWVRPGDGVVADRSSTLDNVTESGYSHGHGGLRESQDSMNQAREYLLDDPPPPPDVEPGLDEIAAVQLLDAFHGTEVPSGRRTISVDTAAARLQVALAWQVGDANSPSPTGSPAFRVMLGSPAGIQYDTSATGPGFTAVEDGGTLLVTIDNPVPGSWTLQIAGTKAGPRYSVLVYQESRTFLAIGLSAHQKEPGQPVQITAYLQSGGAAASGATVYAAVAPPAGATVSIPMVEEPRFAGLYVGTYTPVVEGTYKVLAAADVVMPSGVVVTRSSYSNFDARLRAELTVEISSSAVIAKQGDALRLTALVRNTGKANAPATPVQFFEGLPQRGRLLGTRTVDVPAGGEARVSILWYASAGGHHFVVVADQMNATEAVDEKPHVSEMVVVIVDDVAPVARAGADQIAAVGQTLVLDGRASTDNDAIVKYVWKFPTVTGNVTLEGAYVAMPGGLPGPDAHVVELVVTDASGNVGTDTLNVRVVDALDTVPPVADAGEEMSAIVGAPVAFDGAHSRDDFGIAYATWDVDLTRDSDGDGNSGNDEDLAGLSPTYFRGYARAGRYRARLTVRDAAGNGPATSTVIVNVIDPAANCTVTVPPAGNLQRILSAARSGETICLEGARHYTSGLVMTTPGVTLEGQGAVLEHVASASPAPSPSPSSEIGPFGIRAETSAGADGVTVSDVTIRGFTIGLGAGAGNHRFIGNTIEGGVAGVVASFSSTAIERNRVRGAFYGYVLDGTGHRVVNNSASGNSIGFVVGGSGHVIAGNDACANSIVDFQLNGAATGHENACGTTAGWSDAGRSGCTFRCDDIRIPRSGLIIDRDTFFASGTYALNDGLVVTGSGVHVHFAGTEITGPEGGSMPGIEVRNVSGATLSGATINGFRQGVRVTGGAAVELSDLEIDNAEIGVEASGGRNGALRDVRVTHARQGLRLDGATSLWTIENGRFTGDVDIAGSGHVLSANRIEGRVAVGAGASGARLRGNTIVSKSVGVLVDSANAAEIDGNSIYAEGAAIVVHESSRSKITGNAVLGHRGIVLDGGDAHTVFDNRVEGVGAGVQLSGTRNVLLEKNTVTVGNGAGVILSFSSGNRLAGNDLRRSRHGLDLQSSHVNRILGNVFADGMTPGITLHGSHANDVAGNTLSDIWPGGVLAIGSSLNRIVGNKLRPSGASPREITALGISLASDLRDSPNLPKTEVERAVARGWESLRVFAGRDRIRVATGSRFFEGLGSSIGVFMELGRTARADVDRDLIRNATAQMARGASLAVRRAISDAREMGGDSPLVRQTEAQLAEGEFFASLGRPDLAVASFGRAWTVIRQSSASPARLSATMTVIGVFTKGSEVVYTVIITNAGPRVQRDNPGDEFADRLPPDLDAIEITASSGQANIDRATNGLAWNGAIASGASVRLTIRAAIKSGTVRRSISNQGTVSFDVHGDGLNDDVALTDDPTIGGTSDATTFTVRTAQVEPEPIPVLSPELLAIFMLLLGAVAFRALGRSHL